VLADDEFMAMVERAHGLRADVAKLGFSGSEVDANVKARLYWNPKVPALAVGHEALANEVHTLLSDPRLSAPQAAQLEREYFPPRS
jgi:hypothetical protein